MAWGLWQDITARDAEPGHGTRSRESALRVQVALRVVTEETLRRLVSACAVWAACTHLERLIAEAASLSLAYSPLSLNYAPRSIHSVMLPILINSALRIAHTRLALERGAARRLGDASRTHLARAPRHNTATGHTNYQSIKIKTSCLRHARNCMQMSAWAQCDGSGTHTATYHLRTPRSALHHAALTQKRDEYLTESLARRRGGERLHSGGRHVDSVTPLGSELGADEASGQGAYASGGR